MQPSFLTPSGGRRIAYVLSEGKRPTVVFMGGFKSDMSGTKAMALEAYCKARGQRFLRFDYTGHGQSSGAFEEGTIGGWKADALAICDALAGDNAILVGSSMGAWLALLVARERPGAVSAIVAVAAAPDFTERLIRPRLTPEQTRQLTDDGVFYAPSCYGEAPYPITSRLLEEARKHLLLDAPIALHCPVRLLHGTQDEDVPWQLAATLMETLASANVRLQLVKGGNHRLSEPAHLALLCGAVGEFIV